MSTIMNVRRASDTCQATECTVTKRLSLKGESSTMLACILNVLLRRLYMSIRRKLFVVDGMNPDIARDMDHSRQRSGV